MPPWALATKAAALAYGSKPVLHLGHYRVTIPASVVALSLVGAGCYALASAMQHEAAARQRDEDAVRPRLLVKLVRNPRWVIGNIVNAAGYGCQFLALRRGSQGLVQPLFLTSLVYAVLFAALLEHRKVAGRDLLGATVVVVGIGGLVVSSRPGSGNPRASLMAWVVLTALVTAVVAACVVLGRERRRRRGILLSVAGGTVFGYASAVGERTARLLDHGVGAVLTSWSPYVLILAGVTGLLLAQSAFQAGALRLSLPALTVTEPVVAIAIGQVLFGEHAASSLPARIAQLVALAVTVAAVFDLARTAGDRVAGDNGIDRRAGVEEPQPGGRGVE
ncbi:MAG: DMT family transporter [Acidimicrobiales bacterium]